MTRKHGLLLVIALVAVLAIVGGVMAGCGSSTTTTTAATTATTVAPETTTTAAAGPTTTAAPEETTTTVAAIQNTKIKKIGIVTPEVAKDYGWNQQGVASAKNVATALGVPIVVNDGAGYGDISPILRQLSQGGADLLFAFASGYNTVGPTVAQQLKVPTVVIGANEQGLVPNLVQDIETNAQAGAYLAGVLAAKTTKSKTVGIVISADDENWTKMAAGFATGVRATDPSVKMLLAQVGQAAYADAAAAKRTTQSVIAGGADIIFGMGDGASFGEMQAVETATPPAGATKVWFIDVIGDKTSIDTKGVLLSSQIWDYTPAFQEAADALNSGTFGTKVIYINLQNNGIGLLKTKFIADDVWTAIEAAKADIISGKVQVPAITDKAAVDKLVKGQ